VNQPTSRRDLLALLGLALAGGPLGAACAGGAARRRGPSASADELEALVSAMRGADAPFALQGRFSVRLESPGVSGTTKGALVLHQPDRFRIEIHSPFGTPMVLIASDGQALHAWAAKDNRFFRGDDAAAVLSQLTAGAVALSDVNAMLTGALPLPQAPVLDLAEDDEGLVRLTLAGPEAVQVRAVLDPRTQRTRQLRVLRAEGPGAGPVPGLPTGETLLQVDYLEVARVGRSLLPEQLRVSLPTLGWSLELEFLSWDELGRIPEVFALTPPPGATERDLVQTLQGLAEAQAEGPGDQG
jgi:hypothetical protein